MSLALVSRNVKRYGADRPVSILQAMLSCEIIGSYAQPQFKGTDEKHLQETRLSTNSLVGTQVPWVAC